jgi:hypothetical protein
MDIEQGVAAGMAATEAASETRETTLARLSTALGQELGVEAEADRLYVPPGEGQARVRRILVLVPQAAGLDAELAQRAWRLAAPSGLPIVLVGLAHDSASEAQRRRQLASLAALTRGEGVSVSLSLALEQGWLPAVQRLWRPGDLVVCVAGQVAAAGWLGLRHWPLQQALQARLHAPFYEARLSGEAPSARFAASPLTQTQALLAALAVVVGSFWLQVQVLQLAQGLAENVLLLLSVLGEFALIGLIGQSFFGGEDKRT